MRRVKMSTLAALAAATSLMLAGCSTSATLTQVPSSASPCPMVGPNGCETASPGTDVNAKLDPGTRAACAEITQVMNSSGDLDLTNEPIQVVVDDAASSTDIDIREKGKALAEAWHATTGNNDAVAAKLKLVTAATNLETACVKAGWKASG